jgi:hypothetical protein
MTSALQAARERLAEYVMQLYDLGGVLNPAFRDVERRARVALAVRRLEDELVQATRHETGLPF